LRILFVSSEAYPLIKTGGLADVSGSLPAALRALGADVRLLIPGYPAVLQKLVDPRRVATVEGLPVIGSIDLVEGEMPGTRVPVLAISAPSLYERAGGPYVDESGLDWADNPLRFGILSKVAAILSTPSSPLKQWLPDLVHCNDWQSGLTPAFMHYMGAQRAKSVLGIHNLAFQGNFSAEWVGMLGLPPQSFDIHGVEYYGQLSFLKAGIYYSDSLTTVSPTYAKEIQTEAFGFGLQGLLSTRGHEIHGILNGIETQEWDPASDPHLVKHYDAKRLAGKSAVKTALQKQLGLYPDAAAPLLGVVSRLTYQKGLDTFLSITEPLLHKGCQIALLGGGEASLEQGFRMLSQQYPLQVSTNIGYNEALSHQIMAGADIFIMPSRFEPCGLNQMYGLRYGTPPLVTRTGGLADSVTDTNEATIRAGTANGFMIESTDPEQLLTKIQQAIGYLQDAKLWRRLQRNGMGQDLGWGQSARAYMAIYEQLIRS
jgi:starch synthase